MLGPRYTIFIFTDRKARRVRMTAPFCTDGFAWVEGCRRRSMRIAIDAARDVHKGRDAELEETTMAYKLQHQHSNEKRSVGACELREMVNTKDSV